MTVSGGGTFWLAIIDDDIPSEEATATVQKQQSDPHTTKSGVVSESSTFCNLPSVGRRVSLGINCGPASDERLTWNPNSTIDPSTKTVPTTNCLVRYVSKNTADNKVEKMTDTPIAKPLTTLSAY